MNLVFNGIVLPNDNTFRATLKNHFIVIMNNTSPNNLKMDLLEQYLNVYNTGGCRYYQYDPQRGDPIHAFLTKIPEIHLTSEIIKSIQNINYQFCIDIYLNKIKSLPEDCIGYVINNCTHIEEFIDIMPKTNNIYAFAASACENTVVYTKWIPYIYFKYRIELPINFISKIKTTQHQYSIQSYCDSDAIDTIIDNLINLNYSITYEDFLYMCESCNFKTISKYLNNNYTLDNRLIPSLFKQMANNNKSTQYRSGMRKYIKLNK